VNELIEAFKELCYTTGFVPLYTVPKLFIFSRSCDDDVNSGIAHYGCNGSPARLPAAKQHLEPPAWADSGSRQPFRPAPSSTRSHATPAVAFFAMVK
jgi:hypothetical protein